MAMTAREKEKVMCECGAGPMSRKHYGWWHPRKSDQHKEWAARQTMNIYEVNAAHQAQYEAAMDAAVKTSDSNNELLGKVVKLVQKPEDMVAFEGARPEPTDFVREEAELKRRREHVQESIQDVVSSDIFEADPTNYFMDPFPGEMKPEPRCDHTEIPNGTRCNKCEKMVWKRMGRSRG